MGQWRSTCSLWRTPHWSRWISKRGCDPVGTPAGWSSLQDLCIHIGGDHTGLGLLAGLVTLWGTPIPEQSDPGALPPVEGTQARAVSEELQPMGSTHVGEVDERLSLLGITPWWSRGRVCGGRTIKGKAWWTDHSNHYPSSCAAVGVRVRETEKK